MKLGIGIAQLV